VGTWGIKTKPKGIAEWSGQRSYLRKAKEARIHGISYWKGGKCINTALCSKDIVSVYLKIYMHTHERKLLIAKEGTIKKE
jgi:hypothetical protein